MSNPNFGDGVNKVFFNLLAGEELTYTDRTDQPHYLCTGSILCLANKNSVIYGTGFISENGDLGGGNYNSTANRLHCQPTRILSVRGPRTRDKFIRMGIECPESYGDPLILFPCVYPKKSEIIEDVIGVIPHYTEKKSKKYQELVANLRTSGYRVVEINIEIGNHYKGLINNICTCKYIITSSLHGLIMGIVYRKKSILVQFSDQIIGGLFKFYDFLESIGVSDYEVKNTYDEKVLDNVVSVDYRDIVSLGKNMIHNAEFLSVARKEELIHNLNEYYNIDPPE